MSRKRKAKKPSGSQLYDRARRELSKGNAKSALKDAKVCYRKDASSDHRLLLEEAYVSRVEQLRELKMSAEARSTLLELIELNPTAPVVQQKIPRLQLIVGDSSQAAVELLQSDTALLNELIDQAVLDRQSAAPDIGQTREHVQQVRAALDAVEAGNDQQAAESLNGISRGSPLGDWKLFVRGLSAFYRSDSDRMEQNWRRLDTARPASRIARTLAAAIGDPKATIPADIVRPLRKLKQHGMDGVLTSLVRQLADDSRTGNWQGFFSGYRRLVQRFGKSHAGLIEGVTDIAWKRAVRDGERLILKELTRIGVAPRFDPAWNRANAFMAEHPQETDAHFVEKYWIRYAADIKTLPDLTEEQRLIAQSLVYERLGRLHVEYALDNEGSGLFSCDDPEGARLFRKDATKFYRQSIELYPGLHSAYVSLAQLYEEREKPEEAAQTYHSLLERKPHDFDAHIWLANYYLSRDEPVKSEPNVEAAFRLKPRDSASRALLWNQHATGIRCLTRKRKFEAAREAWEAAAKVSVTEREPYALDAMRAAIEFKAKNSQAAQQYLDAALAKVKEPTAVWMQMSCLAARYSCPRDVKKGFDDRFKQAIKRKVTSQTAGCLARLLIGLKRAQINYTGRATQERLTIRYLDSAKKVAWAEKDLLAVCEILFLVSKKASLRDSLVHIGLDLFPANPSFHCLAGRAEIEKGPFMCRPAKAQKHMQRVLELAHAPEDQALIEAAQEILGMIRHYEERSRVIFGDLHDRFCDEFADDEESDDDHYESSRPRMTGAAKVLASMQSSMPPDLLDVLKRMAMPDSGEGKEEVEVDESHQGPSFLEWNQRTDHE